jgi:hypothetical protein
MVEGVSVFMIERASDQDYEFAITPDGYDVDQVLAELQYRRVGDSWTVLPMCLHNLEPRGRPVLKRAQMPWFGEHLLMLRDEAIDGVGPLLEPWGELLELDCPDARLVVFNPRTLLAGALDVERSDLRVLPSGNVGAIYWPVFNVEVVEGVGAFRVAEQQIAGELFLAGWLVEEILATGLTAGTSFIQVFPRPKKDS